jgi:Caspase domain
LIKVITALKPVLPALRLAAVACALTVASASAQAPLDVRIALIIGNSAYSGNMALVNPANDALAMTDVLKRLGFTVIELRDGNKAQMTAAIAKVSDSLKGKQGVGMLYYAGHGLQLDWRNYMVPVDANLKTAADVAKQTIDLSSVVDTFKAAGNRMNIVVLDACRDNPFGASTSSGKGLAQLDAPPSTLLAYATAPGNVADDGDTKSGNGLYTQYLLQELKRPAAKIEDVFKRVRLNVRKQSDGRQIPWESTSLEDDFFFNDGAKYTIKPDELARMAVTLLGKVADKDRAAEAARLTESQRLAAQTNRPDPKLNKKEARDLTFSQAKAAWDQIKTSDNPADLYNFLLFYPNVGEFSEAAQYRLDELAKPKVVATLGKGQDASLAYSGPRYRVGDKYEVQLSDSLTGVEIRKYSIRVAAINNDRVTINGGDTLLTKLGATIMNSRGTYDPPIGGFPVELQVGKKWHSASKQTNNNGESWDVSQDTKIIALETISVPAGTFQTYVVEQIGVGTNFTNITKFWLDPRYGQPIKMEELVRNQKGNITRSEKRELLSIAAKRS